MYITRQLRNYLILTVFCVFAVYAIVLVTTAVTEIYTPRVRSADVVLQVESVALLPKTNSDKRNLSDVKGSLDSTSIATERGKTVTKVATLGVGEVCGSLIGYNSLKPLEPRRGVLTVGGNYSEPVIVKRVSFLKPESWNAEILKWKLYIDPHEYRYLVNPVDACLGAGSGPHDPSNNITLLVLVTTALANFARRDIIRRSWMRAAESYCLSTKTLFLLGTTGDPHLQAFVSHESNFHGDIIQEEFQDSYLNLSIKTVMGLKWATLFCPNAEFVIKTDDDVMLNIVNLTKDLSSAPPIARKNFLTARRMDNSRAMRDPMNKWYTPKSIFQGKTYPPYPEGHGYIMSADVVRKLYEITTSRIHLFPWEDVFIGKAMHELGLDITNLPSGSFNRCLFGSHTGGALQMNRVSLLAVQRSYFSYDLLLQQMVDVWSVIYRGKWPYMDERMSICNIRYIQKNERLPELWAKLNNSP